jgi:hypothetical protein
MGTPTPSSVPRPSRRRTTTPAPPLAPTEARRPPIAAAVAPPRRNRGAPRQAPIAAAVQPRWHPHHFELWPKSSHQTPLVLLRLRSPGPGRRFTGIWPDRRRPVPGDNIARSVIFLGCFVWSKGMVMNLQKLPGASAQKETSTVYSFLQELVKCVENRRNFWKLQT